MPTDYIALAREKERLRQLEPPKPVGVEPVVFTGSAREFFGIWLVNLLLSVLTLGIYSAWAKVRVRKYFARNLFIGGRSFDYHARGLQILIGRLVVVGVLVGIAILGAVEPLAVFALYPLMILLFPWLIVRSLRFSARNTSWSNVRFDFTGGYGAAFMTYIVVPIGVALTFYLTIPFLTRARHRFFVANHRLGDRAFSFEKGIGGYYLAVLLSGFVAVILGTALILAFSTAIGDWFTALTAAPGTAEEPTIGLLVLIYAAAFLVLYPTVMVHMAMVRNLMYDGAELEGGHRFGSHVGPMRLIAISVTNALAVTLTLGLALPWAQVRMVRFLAESTVVLPEGSFDDIAGRIEADASAIGDAYTDLEGIEIGGVGI